MFNKFSALWNGREAFAATRTGIAAEYFLLCIFGAFSSVIFPGINWSVLAWVVLLPLFFTIRHCSAGGAFLRGLAWGYFWSLCSFFWLREIAFPIPFILSWVLALFPAFWTLFLHFLWRNLAWSPADRLKGAEHCAGVFPFKNLWIGLLFVFSASGAWCVLEWTRGWVMTGLPWNYLGTSQWKNLPLIQICEFTGVFGVSFLVAFFNLAIGLAVTGLLTGLKLKTYQRSYPLMAAFLLLLGDFSLGLHLFRANGVNSTAFKTEAVGVVQCDISQRRTASYEQAKEALDVCLDLSRKLLEEHEKEMRIVLPDRNTDRSLKWIVWPETAVPYAYMGDTPLSEEYRDSIGALIRRWKVPFLVGSLDFQPNVNPGRKYDFDAFNAALLLTRDGGRIEDRYYKYHRVPFGEYVPYGDEFPSFNRMVGMGRNLTPGKRFNPIEVSPGVKAGVSICYESVFPKISRGHAINGANLLLVISNDAWYPTSYESDQHFANGLFRAIEMRLPLLRCGNSNYSVLISPRGEILDSVSPKKNPGLRMRGAKKIMVPVPLEPGLTFYARYGNLFIALCAFLSLCAMIVAFVNWMMFRTAQADAKQYKAITEGSLR